MLRVLLIVLVLAATAVAAFASAPERDDLPLTGTTPRGQDWRLQAAKPSKGQRSTSSWCLKLRYTTGAAVVGDRFGGSLRSCGDRPAARVSGFVVVDCERGSVFVFGAARSAAKRLRLKLHDATEIKPGTASLPPNSGFAGRSFIAVADLRDLPAELTASRVGHDPIVRIGRRAKVCVPYPGAPGGGEPSLEFASSR